MRLCVVVPITSLTHENLNQRIEYLKGVARADTTIEMWSISEGPMTIESRYDRGMAVAPVLELVRKACLEGFDAVGIWCSDDPAVGGAREISEIPVIGPGESSLSLAYILGRRYGIITPGTEGSGSYEWAEEIGYAKRLVSVKGAGLSVLQLREDRCRTLERLMQAGREAIKEGAEVLVLGCLGMVGYSRQMEKCLGIPVVDPAYAMVAMAELFVHYGLTFSKMSYPVPSGLAVRV